MAARDWSKVDWTNNEDNNLIREFLADSDNIMNCNQCPYKMKHPSWDALPCGQYLESSEYVVLKVKPLETREKQSV